MRDIVVNSEEEAIAQLNEGESLWPAGGVFGYKFYSIVNDEDFCRTKEEKLNLRRQNRRNKHAKIREITGQNQD